MRSCPRVTPGRCGVAVPALRPACAFRSSAAIHDLDVASGDSNARSHRCFRPRLSAIGPAKDCRPQHSFQDAQASDNERQQAARRSSMARPAKRAHRSERRRLCIDRRVFFSRSHASGLTPGLTPALTPGLPVRPVRSQTTKRDATVSAHEGKTNRQGLLFERTAT
jgi:hypothetical protein